MLKHGILGLLNYQEMTGYEINTVFRDSLYYFWNAQTSQIYRELQTLEQKGWVRKRCVPQKGKPDKNIYSATPQGREELLRWLSEGTPDMASRDPLLMKVFFLGEQSREENIRYFQALKSCCRMFMESLEAVPGHIAAYSAYLEDREKALYWQMTVDYGLRNMRMIMEWAESCIERLRRETDLQGCG